MGTTRVLVTEIPPPKRPVAFWSEGEWVPMGKAGKETTFSLRALPSKLLSLPSELCPSSLQLWLQQTPRGRFAAWAVRVRDVPDYEGVEVDDVEAYLQEQFGVYNFKVSLLRLLKDVQEGQVTPEEARTEILAERNLNWASQMDELRTAFLRVFKETKPLED
jgi:hypothetical protein